MGCETICDYQHFIKIQQKPQQELRTFLLCFLRLYVAFFSPGKPSLFTPKPCCINKKPPFFRRQIKRFNFGVQIFPLFFLAAGCFLSLTKGRKTGFPLVLRIADFLELASLTPVTRVVCSPQCAIDAPCCIHYGNGQQNGHDEVLDIHFCNTVTLILIPQPIDGS